MTLTAEQLSYPIGRYSTPASYAAENIQEWISIIEALPNWLDICIENLDETQLQTPYRPGGWTVIQVLHHIADSHMNAYIRHKLTMTEDNPTIKPYEQDKWAVLGDVSAIPVNVSITLIHALHRRWGAFLKSLKPEDWERTFYHPEHQHSITLWDSLASYAWHSRHHMEHVRQLRERMGW